MKFNQVKLEKPSVFVRTDGFGVIDLQKTFIPGGGLGVAEGDSIVRPCVNFANMAHKNGCFLFATEDVHPYGHVSLASSYVNTAPFTVITADHRLPTPAKHAKFNESQLQAYLSAVGFQVLWPDHALAGQPETFVVEEIRRHPGLGLLLTKGNRISPSLGIIPDSYSGAKMNNGDHTGLIAFLKAMGITRVFLVGLAGDYCVGSTALDLLEAGFEVWMVVDCQKCVSVPVTADQFADANFFAALGDNPTTEDVMVQKLIAAGCHFTSFDLMKS